MTDRVQVIKWESISGGGTEEDTYPTAIDPNEDGIESRSVFFQNDTSTDETVEVSRDSSNNMTFKDGVVSGTKTLSDLLSGISENDHRQLDQLVHELDESYYSEFTYDGWKVTNETIWTNSGKTLKIREYDYTWVGSKVTQEVQKQYNASGTLVETITLTYVYVANNISNITSVRT